MLKCILQLLGCVEIHMLITKEIDGIPHHDETACEIIKYNPDEDILISSPGYTLRSCLQFIMDGRLSKRQDVPDRCLSSTPCRQCLTFEFHTREDKKPSRAFDSNGTTDYMVMSSAKDLTEISGFHEECSP